MWLRIIRKNRGINLYYCAGLVALNAIFQVVFFSAKVVCIEAYEKRSIPKISPIALIALLFTILAMFSLK